MTKKVKCPNWKCKSVNCIPLTDKKKFSAGKGVLGAAGGAAATAVVGAAALPLVAIGALTGFNGKKKVKMMCQDCGTIFEIKI